MHGPQSLPRQPLVGVLIVVVLAVLALSRDRSALGGLLAFLALLMQCFGPLPSPPPAVDDVVAPLPSRR